MAGECYPIWMFSIMACNLGIKLVAMTDAIAESE